MQKKGTIKRNNMARFYRGIVNPEDLKPFNVTIKQSDLQILATKNLRPKARRALEKARKDIERYIKDNQVFLSSLEPVDVPDDAPEIVKTMAAAGHAAGVGPMASVAGAIAEYVGRALLEESPDVIVENGGDIFLQSSTPRTIAIYAGRSSISMRFGVKIESCQRGLGVCTSSATIGHSLSLGKADAAIITADDTAFADAVATATCNRVTLPSTMEPALEFATAIPGVRGAIIVLGDELAVKGTGFELVELA
jgi:ApbE superfamily uncharacterized protein (UPF0280 family)